MLHQQALEIAHELIDDLTPVTERIEIAGSLRRMKDEVKDIELIVIPQVEEFTDTDMFGEIVETHTVSALEFELEARLLTGEWDWRKDTQVPRWGDRYKRLRHKTGICCDLFITDERRWGYQLLVRTGPADFSKAIVTLALRKGWHFTDSLLHQHRKVAQTCPKSENCVLIMETPEETDVFEALGLRWLYPWMRTEQEVWRQAKEDVAS